MSAARGVAVAFAALALAFEPVRLLLARHVPPGAVGGVGGVGGLCSLGDPASCDTASGLADAYCFGGPGLDPVLLGLSPFAAGCLAAWTVPALGLAVSVRKAARLPAEGGERLVGAEGGSSAGGPGVVAYSLFVAALLGLPVAMYSSSSFYRQDALHAILGASLVASLALSWHLALLPLLAPGPLSELGLGVQKPAVARLHKLLAWGCGALALLHGGGELVWTLSVEPDLLWPAGENWIYALGAAAAALCAVHFAVAWLRARLRGFVQWHRAGAATLLLVAVAHWWPLALLLVPASALHAWSLSGAGKEALVFAVLGQLGGLLAVWELRGWYMAWPYADMALPFVFPPAAVLVGFGAALLAAYAAR